MKTQSIWNSKKCKKLPSLQENLETDILIIGGGMTGLSSLYHLSKNSNLKPILVEANTCGRGVTSKSTAKITYLQDNTIMNIAKLIGSEKAKAYIHSQIEAIELLKGIITREKIDCDFEQASSYLFSSSKKGDKKLAELEMLLKSCGVKVFSPSRLPIDMTSTRALRVEDTYVFHPLKYIDALKEKFSKRIYENSKVTSIEKVGDTYICKVNDHYEVTCKYVVLASHYPYFLWPYLFPLKTHIELSYLKAQQVKKTEPFSLINIDKPTISMRYYESGKDKYRIELKGSLTSSNIDSIKDYFENLTEVSDFTYTWSNNDIITSDYLPYVGPISKDDNTFLLATGYNTWGMTNGTLAGKIIADIITSKENDYIRLFSPLRGLNLAKIIRFPVDVSCSLVAFVRSSHKNRNNKNVRYVKKNGENLAIYKDEEGVEHVVYDRCPHMKCGLIFNEVEKTWDCLCHGSRYDIDGHVIEGPSNKDITYNKYNEKNDGVDKKINKV